MNRRTFIGLSAATLATGWPHLGRATQPLLEVARSPSCGCCGAWVDHMRAAGFAVAVTQMQDGVLHDLKMRLGLQPELWSCHTARIEGYLVEGHVPAKDVTRLLAEQPAALGLAVPGMPIGSPGMEMGERVDRYDTLLLRLDGGIAVFSSHG